VNFISNSWQTCVLKLNTPFIGNEVFRFYKEEKYLEGVYLENNMKILCKHIPTGHYTT
jgi:hypothetical protein